MDAAAELQDDKKKRRKRRHWLCVLLAKAAEGMDPAAAFDALADLVVERLESLGISQNVAAVVGIALRKAASTALASYNPLTQVRLGLNVLALMVCPNPEKCPVGDTVGLAVIKELMGSDAASQTSTGA